VTGDELVQRDDDKPEIIAKRLDLYDQESEPIIDFYTGKDEVKVRRFAGTESDVIYPEVKKFFESEVFV
jgi:nucleoside-triphosphate--adenylate kinase